MIDAASTADQSRPAVTSPAGVAWLFVLTLPNAGSTALAQLLTTAPGTGTLTPTAEGQWLVPELSKAGARWDPELEIDYDGVRRKWFEAAAAIDGTSLIVEKSPPTLCRAHSFLSHFDDLDRAVVALTRDPYAVCSSWAQRYPPRKLQREWAPDVDVIGFDRDGLMTFLGDLWGRRTELLLAASDDTDLRMSYESLCQDPVATLEPLVARHPVLRAIDYAADLTVKDLPQQGLRNMNQQQVDRLSPSDITAISVGLKMHEDALTQSGYELVR